MTYSANFNAAELNNDPGAPSAQVDQSMQQMQAQAESYDMPGVAETQYQEAERGAESELSSQELHANTLLANYANDIKQSQGIYDDENSGSRAMLRAVEAGIDDQTLVDAIYNPEALG